MIKAGINELSTDHVLAKSIFRPNGELLLAAGVQLTQAVLAKLPELEQKDFWIQEGPPEKSSMSTDGLISQYLATNTANELRSNAKKCRELIASNLDSLGSALEVIQDSGNFKNIIADEAVQKLTADIIGEIFNNPDTLVNLNSIRTKSGYLYEHALDVSICSIMLGRKFAFGKSELEELAKGCLLMDLGMMVLPEELVNKIGRYNFKELSLLKEHPTLGYAILKQNPKIPLTCAHVAYQHHERQDGGGFPRRLRGRNEIPSKKMVSEKDMIHRYAEIASVADYYVSLTQPRPGTPAKSPQEVVKIMIKAAGSQLNKVVVDALITMIPNFPVGARVVVIKDPTRAYLGFSGVVSATDPDGKDRPEIVLTNNLEKQAIKPLKLDLRRVPEVAIQHAQLK
jgi:HD-GYP domain-containing protein (c-di-GMP phosphodiesterase class II)